MANVFTLSGSDDKRLDSDGCKKIYNPKTGCTIKQCKVNKDRSRTGWIFKGPADCPRKGLSGPSKGRKGKGKK